MDRGPRMEKSCLAAGLTCIMTWLTNKVQLCCATTSHLCFPLYPSCRNHRIHSIFMARKEYYSDGVGGDVISLMFVDLWLGMCNSTAEEHFYSCCTAQKCTHFSPCQLNKGSQILGPLPLQLCSRIMAP